MQRAAEKKSLWGCERTDKGENYNAMKVSIKLSNWLRGAVSYETTLNTVDGNQILCLFAAKLIPGNIQ